MGDTMNTNDIVASNLTIAYFSRQTERAEPEQIVEVYRHFQELLRPKGDRYDPNENQSWGFQQG